MLSECGDGRAPRMDGHLRKHFLVWAAALAVAGVVVACSGRDDPPGGTDAGIDGGSGDAGQRDGSVGTDAAAPLDAGMRTDGAVGLDAALPADGGVGVDGGGAGDAGVPVDAGAGADASGAAPGMCAPGPCPMECFRAVSCVTVCGGPVTPCGCCACAAGSIDTIGC